MPTVEAHIPTERASRYLVQLCRHTDHMRGMRSGHTGHRPPSQRSSEQRPPEVHHVDWSDIAGTIHFSQGLCTLWAAPDNLTLRINAIDEATLRRLQSGITQRLESIGHRDHLTVHWHRPDSAPGGQPGEATNTTSALPQPVTARGRLGHRGLGRALLWVGAAALVIIVHLGLLGGVLAASAWAGWGVNIVLAIILLKVVTVGVHLVAGRYALRHGKGFLGVIAGWKLRRSQPEPPPTPPRDPPCDQVAAQARIIEQQEHA